MKKTALLAFVATATLAGCSSQYDSKNALEHWYNYHSDTLTRNLGENQAVAVFYRNADFEGKAVNIYVNGDYQASLLEKGFSPVTVCVNKPLFSTSYTDDHKFGNRTNGVRFELQTGKLNYFRMAKDVNGLPVFEAVSAEVAEQELAKLKGEVRHTLPRVVHNNECQIQNKTLSAGALWGINRHSYADMLSEGKKEIAEFAEFVKTQSNITRIQVSGYTDPQASDAYNLALSQKRANTVAKALQQAGVSQPISAVGYGETNLVVADCQARFPQDRKARTACDLPNRRVEITTFGN